MKASLGAGCVPVIARYLSQVKGISRVASDFPCDFSGEAKVLDALFARRSLFLGLDFILIPGVR